MCRHGLGTSQSKLRTKAVEVALPPIVREHENYLETGSAL